MGIPLFMDHLTGTEASLIIATDLCIVSPGRTKPNSTDGTERRREGTATHATTGNEHTALQERGGGVGNAREREREKIRWSH